MELQVVYKETNVLYTVKGPIFTVYTEYFTPHSNFNSPRLILISYNNENKYVEPSLGEPGLLTRRAKNSR